LHRERLFRVAFISLLIEGVKTKRTKLFYETEKKPSWLLGRQCHKSTFNFVFSAELFQHQGKYISHSINARNMTVSSHHQVKRKISNFVFQLDFFTLSRHYRNPLRLKNKASFEREKKRYWGFLFIFFLLLRRKAKFFKLELIPFLILLETPFILLGPYPQNFFYTNLKNLCNFNLDFRTNFTSKVGILLLIM
jgi:hypothetical protein